MNTGFNNNSYEKLWSVFVSFKKAVISPASAASSSAWIFQQEMQILHSESSILIILVEFIHRKIKTPN